MRTLKGLLTLKANTANRLTKEAIKADLDNYLSNQNFCKALRVILHSVEESASNKRFNTDVLIRDYTQIDTNVIQHLDTYLRSMGYGAKLSADRDYISVSWEVGK